MCIYVSFVFLSDAWLDTFITLRAIERLGSSVKWVCRVDHPIHARVYVVRIGFSRHRLLRREVPIEQKPSGNEI